jgi:PAS domain S-box-containing protein
MHWHLNPYSVALIVTTIISGIVGMYVWQRRPKLGSIPVALFMVSAMIWSLAYALEIAFIEQSTKIFWAKMQYFSIVSAPMLLLIIVLEYTRREEWLTRRNIIILSIIPTITLMLTWTNEIHGLIWKDWILTEIDSLVLLSLDHGWFFWVHLGYSYLVLLSGAILLLRMLLGTSRFYRPQASVILAGALLPWLGNLIYILGLNPFLGLDLTPFAFSMTGLITSWGLFRLNLFDLTPIARSIVVNSMNDGIIVLDAQNRIVDINPWARKFLECDRDEAMGKPIDQFLRGWSEISQQIQGMAGLNQEITIDGTENYLNLNLRISQVHDQSKKLAGNLIILHDVTARREAEAEIRKLSQAIEHSANSVIVTDLEGTIEYVNPAFTRISGYTSQEALGQNPRILKSGKMATEFYEEMWHTLTQGENWSGEMINKKKNGDFYWETVTISPVKDDKDMVSHYVAIKEDITIRKQMEEELIITRDQALEASRLKSQLLANVSHDMRTPLGAILGYTEMLQSGIYGPVTEEQVEKLNSILVSSSQLLDFASNLLGQSEIESGKLFLDNRSLSPRELLQDIHSVALILAEKKGLTLSSEVAPDVPEYLMGDYYWLQRIITNLVSNAVKFTDEGSVHMRIFLAEGHRWVFQVSDTGVGISEAHQAHIFDPFYKGDNPADEGYQHTGVGLGLAIVKEIVTEMGGEVTYHSQPCKGSKFTIFFPLQLQEENHD